MVGGIGSLISGVGGAVGSIMGAAENAKANKTNNLINMANLYMQIQERMDTIRSAGDLKREQYAGGSDSMGNRTMYIPGRGWVSILSGEGQGLQDAQTQEQFNKLLVDQPNIRRLLEHNAREQGEDRLAADAMRRQT